MTPYPKNQTFKPHFFIALEDLADTLYSPIKNLFVKTIPVEKAPVVAFIISLVYCFLIIKYLIFIVDTISEYSSFPIVFIGASIYTWGRNIGGKRDIRLSSVL